MPELIGSFFGLKVITLLCLTVFLGNYSVIKKIHVFNGGLKVRSVICYGVGGLQIPWFDRSNPFYTTDCKSVETARLYCTIAVPCKYYRCAL